MHEGAGQDHLARRGIVVRVQGAGDDSVQQGGGLVRSNAAGEQGQARGQLGEGAPLRIVPPAAIAPEGSSDCGLDRTRIGWIQTPSVFHVRTIIHGITVTKTFFKASLG